MFGSRFEGTEPLGFAGGKPGGPSIFYVIRNGKKIKYPSKVGRVPLEKGDRIVMRPCGGAGLGNPKKRKRELIERDLKLGYVSRKAAAKEYGYQPKSG